MDMAVNRTDDISAALYSALKHKRCVLCGRDGEIHHVDAIGMGRNRLEIIHLGMRVICLCREHHSEAHQIGQKTFDEKYHVYGIKADGDICRIWGLGL